MFDAILGKKIDVPTLNGNKKIKIESGSQPNTIIKLKGEGLPRGSYGKGDQYIRLVVVVPRKLNKYQKEILEKLRDDFDHGKTI